MGRSVARECARCARAQPESGASPAPTRSSFNARRAAASSDSACANWPRARTTSCSRYFRKTSASLFKATSAASRLVAAEIRRCLYRSKSASARCSWSLVIGRVVSSCWRLPRNRMTRRSEAVVIATKVQPAMADCPKNAPTAAIPHATTTPPQATVSRASPLMGKRYSTAVGRFAFCSWYATVHRALDGLSGMARPRLQRDPASARAADVPQLSQSRR